MTPLLTVILLFWGTLTFGTIAAALDPYFHRSLRSSWKMLCLLLLLTLLWRMPWDGVFFHGLEYEDSYVYTVDGRQIAERVSPPLDDGAPPFSFGVCAVGSIKNCSVWESFHEHLIGYPYVLGLAIHLGYTPDVGSILNIAASLLSVILVFMLALTIGRNSLGALLSGLLFAAIPVFAVYGLETSAEPFSCCCMLLVLWLCLGVWRTDAVSGLAQGAGWLAYTCALLFSQTVKRENALLALALPPLLLLVRPVKGGEDHRRSLRMGLMIVSSSLAFFLGVKMHLLATSQSEQELLRQFPLTGAHLLNFICGFLNSFLVFRWYGGTFLIVIVGVIVAFAKRDFALIPAGLLVIFVIVYSAHIRGYYEMESGRVSPESALRFSMNLMGLWAITGGLGCGWLLKWAHRHLLGRFKEGFLKYFLQAAGVLAMFASIATTTYIRRDAVEDEQKSRFTPAFVAVRAASQDPVNRPFILTMDPLVVQLVSPTTTRIVDLESLDAERLEHLLDSKPNLILLKEDDRFMNDDLNRYGKPIRQVLSFPSRKLDQGVGFSVSRIELGQNQPSVIIQKQH